MCVWQKSYFVLLRCEKYENMNYLSLGGYNT